jgi:hypothetical protein
MAVILFPVYPPMHFEILGPDPKADRKRLLNVQGYEGTNLWWQEKEVDGVELAVYLSLTYDDAGLVNGSEENFFFPRFLYGNVLLEAGWESHGDDEYEACLDIRDVIPLNRDGVILKICQTYSHYRITQELDISARKVLNDSISCHIKNAVWDLVIAQYREKLTV